MNKIHVFFSINDDYAKYLSVAMISILKNTKNALSFHIINSGLSPESVRKINFIKKNYDCEINFYEKSLEVFDKIPDSVCEHVGRDAFNKLFTSKLDDKIDKAIILDVDLVFDDDIKKLWDIDLEDNYMAAVVDQVALLDKSDWIKNLNLPSDFLYVNSGVMVANLKKWREEEIFDKLFENINKYSKFLKFPDQDAFNITFAPKIKYIFSIFNAAPYFTYKNEEEKKEALKNPVVIHWAGGLKPWHSIKCMMSDIFFFYARFSPFYEEIMQDIYVKTLLKIEGGGITYKNFFEKIFSCKKSEYIKYKHKVITCFGFRFIIKLK